MPSKIAVVADDLTGAADTGVQFTRRGVPARVMLEPVAPGEGVTVYDLDSRSLDGGAAAARVARLGPWLRSVEHVYKKVDSTMRGNIGAEVDALLEALSWRLAVIAPAFPANGRTTTDGVQRLRGMPVHETSVGRDPAHPMPHATIRAALAAGSDRPVVELRLAEVRQGASALEARLTALPTGTIAIADAETDGDLALIAAALKRSTDCLPVGSAGLASALADVWGISGETMPRAPDDSASSAILIVVGSLNPVAVAQVDRLAVYLGTPGVSVGDPGGADCAATRLRARRPTVIMSQQVHAASPAQVATAIGLAASATVAASRPDALVLTGGDTARSVLVALGGRGIELVRELFPGVALGRVTGGMLEGTLVVTKAGGFGAPDTLVEIVRYLQEAAV